MKHSFAYFVLFAMVVTTLMACSKSSFDYLGKTYPPTANPEIFMRDIDIEHDYEVMGKVVAEVPYQKKLQYIQNKVMNLAAQNGADAVLFSDVNIRSTGYTRATGTAGTGGRKGSFGGSASKVSDSEMKHVEAVLIKYKEK